MSMSRRPHVTFLLGKPLRMSSIIAQVIEHLHRRIPQVTVCRQMLAGDVPPAVMQSHLIVQRGLCSEELATAIDLEREGMRCVNSALATRNLHDRAVVMFLLAAAALPVPGTVTAGSWQDAVELSDNRPVAIKALDGRAGRGQRVLLSPDGNLPAQPPFDGSFIVQEYVPSNAMVRKIYVVGSHGSHTKALIKETGTQLPPSPYAGVSVEVDPHLADLARGAGVALGMEIYGMDFLYDVRGPRIFDVNPFPGFRNVPGAGRDIAAYLAGLVMD